MFGIRFVKAQPTTYLLKYRAGQVTREGAGLSTFYYGPVTSLVAIPVGSRDAAFIFQETARDFQTLTVQGHVTYRISEPRKAAAMLNFTLKADGKTYESDDPEKLPQRILGAVEVLAQQAVKEMTLKEALRASDHIAETIANGLKSRADVEALGLEILGVSVRAVKPTPETAKALEAEAREAILKTADEAIFARRNFAVEQERAIRETQMDAEASVAAKQNELREAGMVADIALEGRRRDFVELNATNTRTLADAEAYRVGALMKIFEGVDTRVIQALAASGMQPGQLIAQAFSGLAEKAEKIGQLNVSPELLNALMDKPAQIDREAARVRRQ